MQKQAKEIKKHLFLLGGHDLEMQTIVQILTDRNVLTQRINRQKKR